MSKLKELIRNAKSSRKEELVPVTVRMPKELQAVVDELEEQFGLSRQEMLLMLIDESAATALDELNNVEETESFGFHFLNTNKRHSVEDHIWMLENGCAAAFYDPWKLNIKQIRAGDIVFLYSNGVGIVAFGTGTGNVEVKDYHGDKDECHFQKLKDFTVLKTPMKASEIKKILDRNVVFLRTRSGVPDGKKLLEKIQAAQS